MRQLVLDIRPETPRSFDNFVVGANAEVVARLHEVAQPGTQDLLYLHGPSGSGRSHLLQATARSAGRAVLHVDAAQVGTLAPVTDALLLIDDIETLDAAAQIALFNLFNAARRERLALVLTGAQAPAGLPLREDLRTRVAQMLVFEIRPLDDAEKAQTLREQAHARGMGVDGALVDYLLRHGRRDLPSLLAVLDALDAASLERKRSVTLPLLREVMREVTRNSNNP